MKCVRNIIGIIAILTQIILGSGLGVHSPDCDANYAFSHSQQLSETHSHDQRHCGCSHHGSFSSDKHQLNQPELIIPLHDCDCSQHPDSSFTLSPQIILQKIKLLPTQNQVDSSSHIALSPLSLLLSIANPSNAPPPERHSYCLHVPQNSRHFTSIYLGVFTI